MYSGLKNSIFNLFMDFNFMIRKLAFRCPIARLVLYPYDYIRSPSFYRRSYYSLGCMNILETRHSPKL